MKKFLISIAVLALVLRVQALPRHSSEESNERKAENDNDNINGSWNRESIADALRHQRTTWQLDASSAEISNDGRFPELEPYLNKLNQRLSNSDDLSSKPEIRNSLSDLGRKKLLICRRNDDRKLWRTDSTETTFDKGCLGRSLGQVMQLVANIERISGNSPQLSVISRGQY